MNRYRHRPRRAQAQAQGQEQMEQLSQEHAQVQVLGHTQALVQE